MESGRVAGWVAGQDVTSTLPVPDEGDKALFYLKQTSQAMPRWRTPCAPKSIMAWPLKQGSCHLFGAKTGAWLPTQGSCHLFGAKTGLLTIQFALLWPGYQRKGLATCLAPTFGRCPKSG